MTAITLQGPDHFVDLLDLDMRRAGLAGNTVQLQLILDRMPDIAMLEHRVRAWSTTEPVCRVRLRSGFMGTRRQRSRPRQPEFHRHEACAERILADRLRTDLAGPAAPPCVLDLINDGSGAVLALTWHHLLADARGGEYLLARLCGAPPGGAWPRSDGLRLADRVRAARVLRPVFTHIGQAGVLSPCVPASRPVPTYDCLAVNEEESARIARRGREVHPLIGETALLLAASLRVVHSLCVKKKGGEAYLIPVPVSRRRSGCTAPELGNPVSFIYITAARADVAALSTPALASKVAGQIVAALSGGLIDACHAQLGLFGFLPRRVGRWMLRSLMRGEIASCFFAHTGQTWFDSEPHRDVFGARIRHVFHRPNICHPPGLGFFISRHAGCVHITAACSFADMPSLASQLVTHALQD